jgi:hypothetical protein
VTKLGGSGSDLLTPFYTNSVEIGKPKFHKKFTLLISAIVRARFTLLFSQLVVSKTSAPRPLTHNFRVQAKSLSGMSCEKAGLVWDWVSCLKHIYWRRRSTWPSHVDLRFAELVVRARMQGRRSKKLWDQRAVLDPTGNFYFHSLTLLISTGLEAVKCWQSLAWD